MARARGSRLGRGGSPQPNSTEWTGPGTLVRGTSGHLGNASRALEAAQQGTQDFEVSD